MRKIILSNKTCTACQVGTLPLDEKNIEIYKKNISIGWKAIDNKLIEREFSFSDFRSALEFTNKVGELAEEENHHPDIYLAWGKVKVKLWTHKINGLHENDFIMAAKIDRLYG